MENLNDALKTLTISIEGMAKFNALLDEATTKGNAFAEACGRVVEAMEKLGVTFDEMGKTMDENTLK